jgi:hypothetical protein
MGGNSSLELNIAFCHRIRYWQMDKRIPDGEKYYDNVHSVGWYLKRFIFNNDNVLVINTIASSYVDPLELMFQEIDPNVWDVMR